MTDEEKKRLAERVAAQGDAGGSSTNGRLSAPNTNSAMTGLRSAEDLEKGYKSPTPLETAEYLRERNMGGVMLPEVEVVGTAQTPTDGTQTIPQEIPDGSTVMTMGDGNKGVVTPQGQTLVPNAEEYQLPMTADGKVRPVLDMAGNNQVPVNVGAPSVPQSSPVMPMNTAGAIQPVQGNYAPIGTTPSQPTPQGQSAPSVKGRYRVARYSGLGVVGSEDKQKRYYDLLASYLNGDISAKDFLVSTGIYGEEIYNDHQIDKFYEDLARGMANDGLEQGAFTNEPQKESFYPSESEFFQDTPKQEVTNYPNLPLNEDGTIKPVIDRGALRNEPTAQDARPTQEQIANTQAQSDRLRGANSVDNTKGANTEGEYWRVAPKEEAKAKPSQTEKGETLGKGYADYLLQQNAQKNPSVMNGNGEEPQTETEDTETPITNDRAKRLDNALLSDYDDSSLLLQEYAKGLISPEEEERRARRARAAEGWAHIGNIISGFAGLANTKKGSPNIDLADVKDAKVDEWRDKVRTNRNTYDKMRVQLEHQRNLAKWRDANLREKIRMNDLKAKQAETEQDYKKALLTLKEIEADYKQAMVDLQAAKTRAIANKDEREERYLEARLQELQEKINATRKLAEEREARANNIRNGLPANGGSSGSGTSKPVVVGGKEVANPRKLNQGDVNRHIKAVAKNNGIAMTKRGNGLDEKDKTIDELGEDIAKNPKALQELRDRLANGESGGSTTTQSKGEDKTPPSRRRKQNKNDNTPPSRRK